MGVCLGQREFGGLCILFREGGSPHRHGSCPQPIWEGLRVAHGARNSLKMLILGCSMWSSVSPYAWGPSPAHTGGLCLTHGAQSIPKMSILGCCHGGGDPGGSLEPTMGTAPCCSPATSSTCRLRTRRAWSSTSTWTGHGSTGGAVCSPSPGVPPFPWGAPIPLGCCAVPCGCRWC